MPAAQQAPPIRVALYPGSFDPVTCGHLDIIQRGAVLFDRLIVAVAPSSSDPTKQALFSTEERMQLLAAEVRTMPLVEVRELRGLLVNFARENGAGVILKGLRAVSDFEFEYAMALMNRRLAPDIESLYLMTSADYSYLSSSLVKEIARLGGSLEGLVPPRVAEALRQKMRRECGGSAGQAPDSG